MGPSGCVHGMNSDDQPTAEEAPGDPRQPRRREREPRRSETLLVRFTGAELATVTAAAAGADLDADVYVTAAALAAGRRATRHVPVPPAEAMDQLLALRRQLRALEALLCSDATPEPGPSSDVAQAATRAAARAIRRIDVATAALSRTARTMQTDPGGTTP